MEEKHFKEVNPVETVQRLKKILNRYGIEVEEKWSEKSLADTYSLRLVVKGTETGTNGKGLTRELAMASAYAEFFERYQNRALGTFAVKEQVDYFVTKDEKIVTCEELLANESVFLAQYLKKLGLGNSSREDKIKYFNSVEIRDRLDYGLEGEYVSLPFYNVNKKKVELLPYFICKLLYSSNGMCAGNSREEALVQGISEIVERYVQKKLILEKPSLPDIPESYLKKFPYIYERYLKIKEIEGYQVYFKDCSFGGKYPVAALIIVENDTGNYGVKLGCHPNYGIAIERTITEITQGREITDFCNLSSLDFLNRHVDETKNIVNSFKVGMAQYPFELLGIEPTFEFVEMACVDEMDNVQLLQQYLDRFVKNGYTVYIRDESKLEFPSYQVIIPEISEMMPPSENVIKAYNTRLYLNRYLAKPELIGEKECKYIIATTKFFRGLVFEDSLNSRYSETCDCSMLPGAEFNSDSEYLVLLCHVYLEEYNEAAMVCQKIQKNIAFYTDNEQQKKYHKALYHYLTAMYVMKEHFKAIAYLRIYFSDEICNQIDTSFCDPKQVISKLYPSVEQLKQKSNKKYVHMENIKRVYYEMCDRVIDQNKLRDIRIDLSVI